MRKPNHIVLDFEFNNTNNTNYYWASDLLTNNNSALFMDYVNLVRKYKLGLETHNSKAFIGFTKSSTLTSNNVHKATLLKDWEKKGFTNLYRSTRISYDLLDYLNLSPTDYTKKKVNLLIRKYYGLKIYNYKTNSKDNYKTNNFINSININFLRKERLYTKLKYSRSPAYDIVSGGAAALLAGFIGFLISEKFGYELVDSGDFYYAFMYIVFATFSIRPLLTVADVNKGFINCLSLRPLFLFLTSLVKLFFKKFK
jgi:hypothetical protein